MTMAGSLPDPLKVVVAGGGVAGLEVLLALRHLAGNRIERTLLTPEEEFVYRPMSVAEPFACGHAQRHRLDAIAPARISPTAAKHATVVRLKNLAMRRAPSMVHVAVTSTAPAIREAGPHDRNRGTVVLAAWCV